MSPAKSVLDSDARHSDASSAALGRWRDRAAAIAATKARTARDPMGTTVASSWRARPSAPRAVVESIPGAVESRARLRVTNVEQAGCYAGVRSWTSREHWLAGQRLYLRHHPQALTTPGVRDTVSSETYMTVIGLTADAAEASTGRGIRAHKAAIAAAAHCSPDTVQRVWRIATCRLGVLVDVARGRPLTMPERNQVRHGPRMDDGTRARQRGVTPLRAAHTPEWLHQWSLMAKPALDGLHSPEHDPTLTDPEGATPRPTQARTGAATGQPVDIASPPRRATASRETGSEKSSPCRQDTVSLRSTKRTRSARSLEEAGLAARGRPARARKRLVGERLARDLAQIAPWGMQISPRRCAPALAPYELAGWTAHLWLEVAQQVLTDRYGGHWHPPQVIASPHGWIRWLTSWMVPDAPGPLQPCNRPDCDGHGWIPTTDGHTITRCPDCPPGIRAQEPTPDELLRIDHPDDGGDLDEVSRPPDHDDSAVGVDDVSSARSRRSTASRDRGPTAPSTTKTRPTYSTSTNACAYTQTSTSPPTTSEPSTPTPPTPSATAPNPHEQPRLARACVRARRSTLPKPRSPPGAPHKTPGQPQRP
ncbi:MAG: hypothetical protein ACRCYX_12580 [Dermatophilaceae bacterium]